MRRTRPTRRTRLSAATAGVVSLATAAAVAAVPSTGSAGPAPVDTVPANDVAGGALAEPIKDPVAVGRGGAVSSVDPYATRIGVRVLRRGGTAADAAVATAAALGVTEPYSAGIGGGGFLLHYDSATGRVRTIDGRETAPMAIDRDAFIDPDTGDPYPFFPDLVTSGVSVGVPGTPLLWDKALRRWGTLGLGQAIRPAAKLADEGFVVDRTFNLQTRENADRFEEIVPTRRLYLPGGSAPAIGSVFRNPDLADTYRRLGQLGVDWLYDGRLAGEIVDTVRRPPKDPDTDLPVPRGEMVRSDLADYTAPYRGATRVGYRGLDVYGMAPPSSGGSTVGQSLNMLEELPVAKRRVIRTLHLYLESTALAFADRLAYVGDSDFVDVPLAELLSTGFARERSCEIDPDQAADKPVAAGEPDGEYQFCRGGSVSGTTASDNEGLSTTHLTVVDRHGDVVSYTLTIEQTGGSGIVVPQRGFLLNNELTDFSLEYVRGDPNRIQPGKRPRSSMAPTIVLRDDEFWLALGSPGGSTIITTVLQVLLNRVDLDMNLPDAVRAPRATQRNTPTVVAEQEFIGTYASALERYGHEFVPSGEQGTSLADIGAVAAIEVLPQGRLLAVAEPKRRGGGHAEVVSPR